MEYLTDIIVDLGFMFDVGFRLGISSKTSERENGDVAKTFPLLNRFAHSAGPIHLPLVDYLMCIIVCRLIKKIGMLQIYLSKPLCFHNYVDLHYNFQTNVGIPSVFEP